MTKLTPKQEKFCQLIFEGKTQTEAYRGAYACENMKPATCNSKAYELMQNGQITARIAELRAKLTEKTLWNFEQAAKVLLEVVYRGKTGDSKKKSEEPASDSDRLKSVDMLNKMHGIEPPKKVEVSMGGNIAEMMKEFAANLPK